MFATKNFSFSATPIVPTNSDISTNCVLAKCCETLGAPISRKISRCIFFRITFRSTCSESQTLPPFMTSVSTLRLAYFISFVSTIFQPPLLKMCKYDSSRFILTPFENWLCWDQSVYYSAQRDLHHSPHHSVANRLKFRGFSVSAICEPQSLSGVQNRRVSLLFGQCFSKGL